MRALLLAGLLLSQGCAAAAALVPGRIDARVGAGGGGEDGATLTQGYAAGVHLASMTPHPIPVDVGVGYVHERRTATVTMAGPEPEEPEIHHGAYLELSGVAWQRPHRRVWAGLRGEMLDFVPGDSARVVQGTARLSYELFGGVKGGFATGGGDGGLAAGAIGTAGVGGFVEAGYRYDRSGGPDEDGIGAYIVQVGVSLRTPLAGFLLVIDR